MVRDKSALDVDGQMLACGSIAQCGEGVAGVRWKVEVGGW